MATRESINLVRQHLPPAPPSTIVHEQVQIELAAGHANPHPHANWRGLPDAAVAKLLTRLPVLDLFRLGYLFSPRWDEIWRAAPLVIHDRQFSFLPAAAIPDCISNVLEAYLGPDGQDGGQADGQAGGQVAMVMDGPAAWGVELGDLGEADENQPGVQVGLEPDYTTEDDDAGIVIGAGRVRSFQVDSTGWEPHHFSRWCVSLNRGRVHELVLVNTPFLGKPAVMAHPPPQLRSCSSIVNLFLGYFSVRSEDFGSFDSLRKLSLLGCSVEPAMNQLTSTELPLYGCPLGPRQDAVTQILTACPDLRTMAIKYGVFGHEIRIADSGLRRLFLEGTTAPNVILQNLPFLQSLTVGCSPKMQITSVTRLRLFQNLDMSATDLKIDYTLLNSSKNPRRNLQSPTMRCVTRLAIVLDYTRMGRGIGSAVHNALSCFSRLESLEIIRKDLVTEEEGYINLNDAHYFQNHGLFRAEGIRLESVGEHLRHILFSSSRCGRLELFLAKSLLDEAQVLNLLEFSLVPNCPAELATQADQAIRNFVEGHTVTLQQRLNWRFIRQAI